MMNKDDLNQCLESILGSMIAKERSKSKELIKDSLEKLKSSGFKINTPEEFNTFLMHKLNNGLIEISKTLHEEPLDNIKDTHKPNFIYINYDFLGRWKRTLPISMGR